MFTGISLRPFQNLTASNIDSALATVHNEGERTWENANHVIRRFFPHVDAIVDDEKHGFVARKELLERLEVVICALGVSVGAAPSTAAAGARGQSSRATTLVLTRARLGSIFDRT
jgi:hypothetical protein